MSGLDKSFKVLKKSMDNTVLRHTQLSEKSKDFVRTTISKQTHTLQRKSNASLSVTYILCIGVSLAVVTTMLYFSSGIHGIHISDAALNPLKTKKTVVIHFKKGTKLTDIEKVVIEEYHEKVVRFTYTYYFRDSTHYERTVSDKSGKSFRNVMRNSRSYIEQLIKGDIGKLQTNLKNTECILDDSRTNPNILHGRKLKNLQLLVNQLLTTLNARRIILNKIEVSHTPIKINSIVISCDLKTLRRLKKLPIVSHIVYS